MGEDCLPHTGLLTPAELSCDWSVADQRSALLPHHGSPDRRPIADVDVYSPKHRWPIGDLGHIGDVDHTILPRTDAQSHGRGKPRVRDRKGLEHDVVDGDGPAQRQRTSILNQGAAKQGPRRARSINGALRTSCQSAGVVRVRVREHDGCRGN
jgi:hypothetical protein